MIKLPSNNIGAKSASRVHAKEESINVKCFHNGSLPLKNLPCPCQWNGKEMACSDGKTNSKRCRALMNIMCMRYLNIFCISNLYIDCIVFISCCSKDNHDKDKGDEELYSKTLHMTT